MLNYRMLRKNYRIKYLGHWIRPLDFTQKACPKIERKNFIN